MHTRIVLVASALVVLLFSGSSVAEAQERGGNAPIVATPGRLVSARDARLIEESELSLVAPDASEYALPVVGTIVGGAAVVVGGGVFLFGGLFALAAADREGDTSRMSSVLIISGLGALAGGVVLGLSIAELVSLGRRRGQARDAGMTTALVTPTPDGLAVGLAGTF